jgi:hypothetical protein
MSRTHAELKARQRAERHTHAEGLAFRVHRALSWLERAAMEVGPAGTAGDGDPDAQFIFLWIAFNAAYATEITDAHRDGEQSAFNAFLGVLLELDGQNRLADLVWTQFPGPIRGLLDNKFLYRDYWNAHNGRLPPEAWKPRFEAAKAHANKALGRGDTLAVLGVTLDRIYTLRNQLVHGGSTWNGTVNREQVRDCARFMSALVPVIIEIMMDHPRTVWSGAVYPVVAD